MTITRVVFSILAVGALVAMPTVSSANGEMNRTDEYRSKVSKVVMDLKGLAGRDFDVGAEVSEVAKDQETANDQSQNAMEAVEARGGLTTFLFGTDYRNIGVLRSTLVTTDNSIARLEKAMERSTVASVKVNLQSQIDALKSAKADAEAFIEDNESKLSLLGWLVKYFQ